MMSGVVRSKHFAEIAFDVTDVVDHDRNRRARDTAAGIYVSRWNTLERTLVRILFAFELVYWQFVCHSDNTEQVRRQSDWLHKNTVTGDFGLSCSCLSKPLDSY